MMVLTALGLCGVCDMKKLFPILVAVLMVYFPFQGYAEDPLPIKQFLPVALVSRGNRPVDHAICILAGGWGQEAEAAAWASEIVPDGWWWRTGCFPPDDYTEPWPTDECNWKVIFGDFDSWEAAWAWGEKHLFDIVWYPIGYYNGALRMQDSREIKVVWQ